MPIARTASHAHNGGVSSASSIGASQQVKEWGSSGLAYLTGLPDGPADFSRANVLTRAGNVAAAVGDRLGISVDAANLLTGRAALLGLTRGGRVSPGGGTRLLAARDGCCALTLSRADDLDAIPALLQADDVAGDPWPVLQRWAATRPVAEIVERAGLLDIPAAAWARPRPRRRGQALPDPGWRRVRRAVCWWPICPRCGRGPCAGSCWPAPVATVVKVESPRRPDGTRAGNRAFFDWINGEKLCYGVDFDSQADELRELLAVSDVVIEGSRPGGAGAPRARTRRCPGARGPNLVADHRI